MFPIEIKNERQTDNEFQELNRGYKFIFGETKSLLARDSLDKISKDLFRLKKELDKNPEIDKLRKRITEQKKHFCFLMKIKDEDRESHN